ncbi:helix-turn-helix domain-containing protein [Anatilimnocola sp. NA78]
MSIPLLPLDSERIIALFQQGHSRRWLAQRFGVSPSAISRCLRRAEKKSSQPAAKIVGNSDPPPGFDPENLRRCPCCGSLVYLWPCLACQLSDTEQPANPSPVEC